MAEKNKPETIEIEPITEDRTPRLSHIVNGSKVWRFFGGPPYEIEKALLSTVSAYFQKKKKKKKNSNNSSANTSNDTENTNTTNPGVADGENNPGADTGQDNQEVTDEHQD